MTIEINDNFGSNQLLKDIAPNSHMIDIRVRYEGEYYWFEGDFLKHVFPQVDFKRIEHDVGTSLKEHLES